MPYEPNNQEIAGLIGISEPEVQQYRGESIHLGDGVWLVNFHYIMPKELRVNLTGSFTLRVEPQAQGGLVGPPLQTSRSP